MLYVVSTPIGNLADTTFRAVEVLRSADVILAEDTRRTAILLNHFEVHGPRLVSSHEHNERGRATTVVEMLREGKKVALVTDAGTPLLSDPGAPIVRAVAEAGFAVVPVPGASALLAALVVSGISADRFTFYGFLPRRGAKRSELLAAIGALPHTVVLYESPHRTHELIQDLREVAGDDRRIAIGRELTKLHEEVFRGTLGEASSRFAGVEFRGEIAVVMEGRADSPREEATGAATAMASALLAHGVSPSAVARELRDRLGVARNEAYRLAHGPIAASGK